MIKYPKININPAPGGRSPMLDLIAEYTIRKYMKILAIFAAGTAFGYFWHFMAVTS